MPATSSTPSSTTTPSAIGNGTGGASRPATLTSGCSSTTSSSTSSAVAGLVAGLMVGVGPEVGLGHRHGLRRGLRLGGVRRTVDPGDAGQPTEGGEVAVTGVVVDGDREPGDAVDGALDPGGGLRAVELDDLLAGRDGGAGDRAAQQHPGGRAVAAADQHEVGQASQTGLEEPVEDVSKPSPSSMLRPQLAHPRLLGGREQQGGGASEDGEPGSGTVGPGCRLAHGRAPSFSSRLIRCASES